LIDRSAGQCLVSRQAGCGPERGVREVSERMDGVLRPVMCLSQRLVARRHVDLARVSSALCS
jgi:hypothetical protein